jgi:hypothetical protein
MKRRPEFAIQGWRQIGGGAAVSGPAQPQLTSSQPTKPDTSVDVPGPDDLPEVHVSVGEEIRDEIPW